MRSTATTIGLPWRRIAAAGLLALLVGGPAAGRDDDELILIEDQEDGAIQIDDGSGADGDTLVIEGDDSADGDTLVIEADDAVTDDPATTTASDDASAWRIGLDEARLETGLLTKSSTGVDSSNYGGLKASIERGGNWQWRFGGRVDGYHQGGTPDFNDVRLDYSDSYLRLSEGDARFTIGAQTVIWGRIDELPPTDRMSVVDLTRGLLDDLPDRRRAAPVARVEYFSGPHTLDVIWLPIFRPAELPEHDSIWYPINRRSGEILGLKSSAALSSVVVGASINDDAPDDNSGFGSRYTFAGSGWDLGLSLQRNRQSLPYFVFDPAGNVYNARYPRSWLYGGDVGFEALDATWRFEAVYLSDMPVTRPSGVFDTVAAVNYGAGVEFFPGDSDARVNLQVVGVNLVDAAPIIDRADILTFQGSLDSPLERNRWHLNVRVFAGLDEEDYYINPELRFIALEPHEFYLQAHYFGGDPETVGGFYQDNTLIAIGWRSKF